ncbi:MAG TPA: hypothetical protein VHV10_09805, partial [Ktedonobacteraceae bacterium]|nr:hypothetical protein [Ktedonobacteraceae bacterium]
PIHASHDVTKSVLDWEYTREILRAHLRACLRDQHQAQPPNPISSHEGSIPQDQGACNVAIVPSPPQATGGDSHV